ncbi:MAG: hypothetical protein QOK86_07080 [Nitrososphaeraceae archaeon]|nr:hypothetical protein [Nitrososphaeraceae archaeon]
MKSFFEQGTIKEIWKKQGYRLDQEKYYPQSMKGRIDRIRKIIGVVLVTSANLILIY